jgi:class 3 adenylate cyclase
MPIFIDRHYVEGATQHALAHAHEKDLEIQDKYDVKFLTYWFDEERCTAFCLVEGPDKEAIRCAHDESHGLVPNEIIEVDPGIVETFLGRINDPMPFKSADSFHVDTAFRAILFTDLQDSTEMTAMYGDARALHLLHIHNVITRNALRNHQGKEVKHTGDGIMASFKVTANAVKCAREIQHGLREHKVNHPKDPLNVRIGISAGEPIEEHGDFFGKAVQEAARLCSEAGPGEILTSQVIRDLCQEELNVFHKIGDILLKGFNEPMAVFKVVQ